MDWQKIHDNNYTAVIIDTEKNYTAIEKIVVPISKKILIVEINSTTAKSRWNWGGYVTVRSDIPNFVGTEESDFKRPCILHGATRIDLTQLPLLFFDKYPHFISLKIPHWIKEANVKVWQYEGDYAINVNIQNQLDKKDSSFLGSGIIF